MTDRPAGPDTPSDVPSGVGVPDPDAGRPGGRGDEWSADDWTADEWAAGGDPAGHDPVEAWDGPVWEEYRPPMSRGRRLLLVGTVVLFALVVGLLAGLSWVRGQIDPAGPQGGEVELVVVAGSTTESIGRLLADADVITSSFLWNYWTRFFDKGPFQAGQYVFRERSSFDEAVAVLEAGPLRPETARVTIPEGLTVAQIAARLADPELGMDSWDEAGFLAAMASGEVRSAYQPEGQSSLEGLLFPATYEVGEQTDERTFLRRLVNEMDSRLASLDIEARAAFLGLTPYEVLVIASMIEAEALVADERPMISRVIYNRLVRGIPLGIDATSRYEAELAGRGRDQLDFTSDSPYNTRRIQGLPPTPIAAPGMASIEAALAPAEGDWIYYVLADADGRHFFTASAAEFERAKQECIRLDLGCG